MKQLKKQRLNQKYFSIKPSMTIIKLCGYSYQLFYKLISHKLKETGKLRNTLKNNRINNLIY